MPGPLEMYQAHDRDEIPDMETRRRRIEADVTADLATAQGGFHPLGMLKQLATPVKLFE